MTKYESKKKLRQLRRKAAEICIQHKEYAPLYFMDVFALEHFIQGHEPPHCRQKTVQQLAEQDLCLTEFEQQSSSATAAEPSLQDMWTRCYYRFRMMLDFRKHHYNDCLEKGLSEACALALEQSFSIWAIQMYKETMVRKICMLQYYHMYEARMWAFLNLDDCVTLVENKDVKMLATMDFVRLNEDYWSAVSKEEEDRRNETAQQLKRVSNTKDYKCKLCKSRNCFKTCEQTRSADEEASVFVECLDCKFKFKG